MSYNFKSSVLRIVTSSYNSLLKIIISHVKLYNSGKNDYNQIEIFNGNHKIFSLR